VVTQASADTVLGVSGSALTDKATLAGGTADVGGTITFRLYSGASCAPATEVLGSPVVASVTGGNGDYTSPPITVHAPGTYHWVANYTGDPNNNGTTNTCNEANENVLVISPGISITKDPNSQTILSGGTASFAITVNNTGDAALSGVHVTDAQSPDCDRTAAEIAAIGPPNEVGSSTLQPGDTVTYLCTLAGVTSDFTNSATATGTPPVGAPVTATDTADVKVIKPSIKITKTTTTPTIETGASASFHIKVENSGDSPLTDVSVSDSQAPGCARTAAQISADRGTATFAPGDVYEYDCTSPAETAGFTNTAVTSGTDELGNTVTDQSSVDVKVIQPSIKITKTTTTPTIETGATASFHIKVENSGDSPLTDVSVNDAQAPGCARAAAQISADRGTNTFAPGDVYEYDCTSPAETAGFTNTAATSGTDELGKTVTDQSSVDVAVDKAVPTLSTDASGPVVVGNTINDVAHLVGGFNPAGTITFEVFAPGDATCQKPLTPAPSGANVDHGAGDYSSGGFATDTAGDYRWMAHYSGDANNAAVDTACNDANETSTAVKPGILVAKTVNHEVVRSGDTVTYTITVTNTGDSDLTNVHVDDSPFGAPCSRDATAIAALITAKYPGNPNRAGALKAGQSVSYACDATISDDPANPNDNTVTNTATATGTPPVGDDVSATDSVDVLVIHPAISIAKTPDSQTLDSGGTATFTITVTNTGDSTLNNVTVTDALSPGCARTSATLAGLASMPPAPAAGSTVSYTCSLAGVTAGFTNSATATGHPAVGSDVTATDTAAVTVNAPPPPPPPPPPVTPPVTPPAPPVTPPSNPAIAITKNPGSQTIDNRGTAKFTIIVTNTGNTTLGKVKVADALSPNCDKTIGTLAAGGTVTYTCSKPNVTASFTNVAVATGTSPSGQNVTARDSAKVTASAPFKPPVVVTHPKIKIVKNPKSQTLDNGGTAVFTIQVTNVGDVRLSNVTVSDPTSPQCTKTIGTLAAGDSKTYTCQRPNVKKSFVNKATASGTAPNGQKVAAFDQAPVTVSAPFKPPKPPKVVSHKKPKTTG
jgi:uncharacterized repeat protein (TIGR01451 family)